MIVVLVCVCVLMMMMICYLERSLVVFICEWITMMNNHHTVEIIWSLGWSTDNVMIVQFCAWYCYWATSGSHSVGELTQSFLVFFLVIDVFIHVALKTTWVWRLHWYMNRNWVLWCSVLYGMTKQKSSVWKNKTKQNKTASGGKKLIQKLRGKSFRGEKAKKKQFNVRYFSSKKSARHYTNETL